MIAKTKVISAIFPPNKTLRPKEGTPSKAELMETKISGIIEIIATIIKPTIYFDNLKLSAIRKEYFVASVAPLIIKKIDTAKINKFSTINLLYNIKLFFYSLYGILK
jgi:hypothetical protein